MNSIDLFSIERTNSEDDEVKKSRLLREGKFTHAEIEGETIRYQFRVNELYLLIMSNSVSWGEAVYFYLLDTNFNIIDELAIGGDFDDSPFLSNVTVVSDNEIEFSFLIDSDKWRLKVNEKKGLRLPDISPFSVVFKPSWTKRLSTHFDLKHLK